MLLLIKTINGMLFTIIRVDGTFNYQAAHGPIRSSSAYTRLCRNGIDIWEYATEWFERVGTKDRLIMWTCVWGDRHSSDRIAPDSELAPLRSKACKCSIWWRLEAGITLLRSTLSVMTTGISRVFKKSWNKALADRRLGYVEMPLSLNLRLLKTVESICWLAF